MPLSRLAYSSDLMDVERPVRVELVRVAAAEFQHAATQLPVLDELCDGLVLAVWGRRFEERALGEVTLLMEDALELRLQVCVREVDGGGYVLPVGFLHLPGSANGVELIVAHGAFTFRA